MAQHPTAGNTRTTALALGRKEHSMNTYMSRWVEARGTQVQFGNLVGPYMGKPYVYECRTPRDATAFAAFLKQRDPQDDNLPVAVTDADLATYHATQAAQ